MERFRARLKACADSPDSSVTIWHIGGSHVQAGHFSSRMRDNFDSLGHYPAAGRGYIFPYPLAHSNFDWSYRVSGEGEWLGSRSSNPNKKVPVAPSWGILGIAAYTADTTARFSLGTPDAFSRLRILGHASPEVQPLVLCGADTLRCEADTLLQGYVVEFSAPVDSIEVLPMLKDGEYFCLTGLLPEAPGHGGLSYVSTGVNGARTTTWTERCPEFEREMALVQPDLVILGLGINDAACPAKDFKPEKFKNNYRKLLDMILDASPHCAFVFITNNDSWRYSGRRMVHNDNGAAVEHAMLELAEEYDGAVWDLFEIMGGNGSATQWREAGLMKKDRLHFTKEGYRLLGDMLYTAIMEEN
jgi:lysophospholipase L1-like esterase